MPYDLSACGLVTVSTSRFVACALGSHIFGNPNVSNDGTVIIGTVVNGTALSLTDGNAAHTYFKFNTTCGSVIESDSRLTFITSGAPNALVLTDGKAGIGTSSPNIVGFTGPMLTLNGTGNYQGLEIGTSGTTRMTVVSDGLNGYVSTRQAGMCLIFEAGGASEKMRITSTGNVGIGTSSPATLDSGGVNLQIKDRSALFQLAAVNSTYLGNNLYYDGSWKRIVSGYGALIRLADDNNGFSFLTTGTAGANSAVTFTSAMNITNAGRVGIGTASPSTMLQVCGDVSGENAAWVQNTNSAGYGSLRALNNLNCAAVFGVGGSTVGAPYANTGYLYTDANVNFVFSIGTTEKMRITSAGCVGIGTTTPSYRLHVNGTFYAAGSSQDYKQSICNYNTDSCMFMKLKPVTYQYKEEWCHLGKELKSETQIGLIAEDVAEVYPELAILVNEDDQKIVRNVDYEKLSIVLLSEVQKLRKELDELKTK